MHQNTAQLLSLIIVTLVMFLSCKTQKTSDLGSNAENTVEQANDPLLSKAKEIAHKYIITDGHVDLPYRLNIQNFRLEKEYLGIPIATDDGDFDYNRSKEGGLDVPFMSIYLPASNQTELGASKSLADRLIDMIEGICVAHPDKFQIAKSPNEAKELFSQGIIALPMGMENGSGIEDDLSNIDYFDKRGISYITLTHSKVNRISDSSYDTIRTWGGLSPFGEEVVQEMNRVGIMVDISHVSDDAFYDVMRITQTPVIASHSSCRKFTPEFERNMSDDMIRALGRNGGVIQINFGSSFLDGEIRQFYSEAREELRVLLADKGLTNDDDEAEPIIEQYRKENPNLYSDVARVADHIDHVVRLVGINHVGLGSDFDGVGDSLPKGLKDVSQYPNLIHVLLKRGYSEDDIVKILYKNVFRVWQSVEDYAAQFDN